MLKKMNASLLIASLLASSSAFAGGDRDFDDVDYESPNRGGRTSTEYGRTTRYEVERHVIEARPDKRYLKLSTRLGKLDDKYDSAIYRGRTRQAERIARRYKRVAERQERYGDKLLAEARKDAGFARSSASESGSRETSRRVYSGSTSSSGSNISANFRGDSYIVGSATYDSRTPFRGIYLVDSRGQLLGDRDGGNEGGNEGHRRSTKDGKDKFGDDDVLVKHGKLKDLKDGKDESTNAKLKDSDDVNDPNEKVKAKTKTKDENSENSENENAENEGNVVRKKTKDPVDGKEKDEKENAKVAENEESEDETNGDPQEKVKVEEKEVANSKANERGNRTKVREKTAKVERKSHDDDAFDSSDPRADKHCSDEPCRVAVAQLRADIDELKKLDCGKDDPRYQRHVRKIERQIAKLERENGMKREFFVKRWARDAGQAIGGFFHRLFGKNNGHPKGDPYGDQPIVASRKVKPLKPAPTPNTTDSKEKDKTSGTVEANEKKAGAVNESEEAAENTTTASAQKKDDPNQW